MDAIIQFMSDEEMKKRKEKQKNETKIKTIESKLLKCYSCQSSKDVRLVTAQTRSGDEGSTQFIYCQSCQVQRKLKS